MIENFRALTYKCA
uniref:Uncharacterized protein n=1 Tax=Rhizophora mucronata TaxID=61149 RepID=A0A2P2PRC1_RHIMU